MKLREQQNTFAYWDERYRAAGYETVPVDDQKRAIVKGWANRGIPEEEVLRRRKAHAGANIGLLSGTPIRPADGGEFTMEVGVIDADVDSLVPLARAIFAPFVSGKVGGKGETSFGRVPKGIKSLKIYRKGGTAPAIEIFASSGMTVLPPSLHPSGVEYRWVGQPLLDVDPQTLPEISETRIAIAKAIIENDDAWAILEGGPDVKAHDLMLRLTSSGLANLTDDLAWLASVLRALFPAGYRGNTQDEILGMLESAKAKGLGSARGNNIYNCGEVGPIPLGYTKDGSYALLDPKRQTIALLSSGQLLAPPVLVGYAPSDFWQQQFPSKKGANWYMAGEALIAACKAKGPFDPQSVRGRGIWLEGDRIITNLGDPVNSDRYIYLCFKPITLTSAAEFDVDRLLTLLQRFNWRNPLDAELVLGWLAIAPICGVLRWRPHAFIYGPARSGKTTIHAIASTLLDGFAVAADGQSTEAGIRQTVGPDSLPVIIDEFESDQRGYLLQNVLRLARSASSADTPVLRGTPEGRAMTFSLRTSFLFSAINPRGMSPADQSRIVMLELLMHDNNSDTARDIRAEEAHLRSVAGTWVSYMVPLAAKVVEAIEVVEPQIASGDRRHRQNMSTLIAAGFVALHRRVPTTDEAATLGQRFEEVVAKHAEEIERDDALEALEHLFSFIIEQDTVGQMLARLYDQLANRRPTNTPNNTILAKMDLRLVLDGEQPGLLIRNGSPSVERAFKDSKWQGGAWQRALRKLEGAFSPPHPVQFSGSGKKSRSIGIPLNYIPEPVDKLPEAKF